MGFYLNKITLNISFAILFKLMGNSCGGEKVCTLILLGMEQSGKSSITRRLRGEDIEMDWKPTVGFSCDEIDVGKKRCYIYDVGGDVTMRGQWIKHSRVCDGILYIVDGGEKSSVEQSQSLLVDLSAHQEFSRLPIQVMINKSDKFREQQLTISEWQTFIKKSNLSCEVTLCSAMKNEGIKPSVMMLMKKINKKKR